MGTETEVIQVIREAASIQDVGLNQELEDDLGLDSLDQTELVMMLEETFDIEILDEKAAATRTVKDVVELVADMIHGPVVLKPLENCPKCKGRGATSTGVVGNYVVCDCLLEG